MDNLSLEEIRARMLGVHEITECARRYAHVVYGKENEFHMKKLEATVSKLREEVHNSGQKPSNFDPSLKKGNWNNNAKESEDLEDLLEVLLRMKQSPVNQTIEKFMNNF